jgi:23S rRNA pseudouridine2605 synthase
MRQNSSPKHKQPHKRTELQRLLSKRGLASRTKATLLIQEGKVRVNGAVVTDPHAYVSIEAKLVVEGIAQSAALAKKLLIMFHKPKGVVTTASDEKGRKTVYDLLPQAYQHLKAVGRLDMATTGLLLFTNDNHFADALLDPSHKIPRSYLVTVKGAPTPDACALLTKGVRDKGELLRVAKLDVRKTSGKESLLLMTLHEGKNREIRRLCDAIGHPVLKLKRISFGPYELGTLGVGEVREVGFRDWE